MKCLLCDVQHVVFWSRPLNSVQSTWQMCRVNRCKKGKVNCFLACVQGNVTGHPLGRLHFDKRCGENQMKLGPFNEAKAVYLNISPLNKDSITSNKDLCIATTKRCLCASYTLWFLAVPAEKQPQTREKNGWHLESWLWNNGPHCETLRVAKDKKKNLKTLVWPANRNVKRVLNPNKPDSWHVWVRVKIFSFSPMFHF